MPERTKPAPMDNVQWWQIVVGFSPPSADVEYAKTQLRLSPHNDRDPEAIREYYTRLYERNPSYLRTLVNTVNPNTQSCVFPKLSKAMQARIVAGEKPVDFFHGELNKAEAHDALMNGYVMALPYLMRNVYRVLGGSNVRDCTVARWLDAVCKDPERLALLRREREIRPERGPELQRAWMSTDAYVRHIDDLRADDFPNGLKTGVRAAFARSEARRREVLEREEAHARLIEEQRRLGVIPDGIDGPRTAHARRNPPKPVDLIPVWYVPVDGIEILTSRKALEAEGIEMHHCVDTYAGYVMSGECSILKIRTGQGSRGKSTAEVRFMDRPFYEPAPINDPEAWKTKRLFVQQHKGVCNAEPSPANTAKLYQAIEFWHKALEERARLTKEETVAVPQSETK